MRTFWTWCVYSLDDELLRLKHPGPKMRFYLSDRRGIMSLSRLLVRRYSIVFPPVVPAQVSLARSPGPPVHCKFRGSNFLPLLIHESSQTEQTLSVERGTRYLTQPNLTYVNLTPRQASGSEASLKPLTRVLLTKIHQTRRFIFLVHLTKVHLMWFIIRTCSSF